MTYFYTYKITLLKGSLAGHYYYGQHKTSNLNDGYAGSGRIVYEYYKKYGKIEHQTYIKEIMSFYNTSQELNAAEEELISDLYETDKFCLNLVAGGHQCGVSEETRKKISESLKGRIFSEEHKRKIREAVKNRSEETRRKLSEANKKRTLSEETRKKISESLKGKHHSEEAKRKMSESRKGKKHSPHSEETRRKMSEAAKRRTYSNETRKKISEARRGKHWKFDPETNKRVYY